MSFALTSHMPLQAATRQYLINSDAPVSFTLHGPTSYCYLKGIQSPQLKELLAKVGSAFEKTAWGIFFNVTHTFTPTEATDSKSNQNLDDQVNKDLDNQVQVQNIFACVKTAIAEQTDGTLALDLTDVTRLVVQKAEDRSFPMGPHRAYKLGITISEKAVEAAEKSGLVFRKYGHSLPTDERVYVLGVGQTSLV